MSNIAAQMDNTGEDTVLRLQNVSKIYPGTVALHRVNLSVKRGEVHGIIGKNGAGKSTLVGIIAGMISPTEGDIYIGGKKYKTLSRINSKRLKISIVPQEPQVILDCTVAENLFIPDYIRRGGLINWKQLYSRAEELIRSANLNINVRALAGDLSISEQQLLLVLKACYVERAEILILDEASASLSQDDEKLLYKIIEDRKREGSTVLFISHRTEELLRVCDRVTVIRDGRSVSTESCSRLDEESLSSLIVGHQVTKNKGDAGAGADTGEMVLSVEGLSRAGFYSNINFQLRRGEVLGLAGLRGSGRTEVLKGIVGIDPADRGEIRAGKVKGLFPSPAEALKNGVVYLPEDREREGLIGLLSVRENLVIDSLSRVKRGFVINKTRERELVAGLIEVLGIKVASEEQEVSQLSGGNKQKVVVGKILATRPDVYLLDEPTRGVDISAKESILNIVKEKLSRSSGVVITSPGLEDLVAVCHRILVLYKGRVVAEYKRDEFDEGALYMAVQGVVQADGKNQVEGS